MPYPLAQISALTLQQGGPRIQTSVVTPPPLISALILHQDVLPLQPSAVRDAPTPPPLSVSIQGRGGPPPPTSAVRAHVPLLSALHHQRVEPPLQPSVVNPPPLPQILAFPLQRHVPPLQPLSMCAPPPPISVSLQGRGKAPLPPLTLRAYVPLLSALLLRQGVPLRQCSASLRLFLSFQSCLFNEACLHFSL